MAKKTAVEEMKKRLRALELEYHAYKKKASVEQGYMQTLLDNIPDYVYFKDKNRRFVRASSSFCDLFKRDLKYIIGKKDEDLFPEEIAQETVRDDRRVIETGVPLVNKEEGGESIGGEGHWVLTTKVPWHDETGNIIGLFGISKEINDRKRTEEALRESESKFRNLAEQSPNMIFINKRGKVVYANKQCEKALGCSRDEFYADDFNFFTLIAPECIPLIEKNFKKHMRGEEIEPYEYTLISKNGKRIEAIITTKLIDYEGEKAILGIVTDISERKKAEEALQKKELKLKHQSKNLEEVNIALKVLLDRRDKEKADYKENLLVNLKKLVFPYIEKLENGKLDEESQIYINIIKSNLKDIIAPIAKTLSSKYLDLTPSEIQVADLIKKGKTSKEIASMLKVSPKAVSFHRGNIRKKLGLSHQKTNLRTYLQSFPDRDA